MHHKNRSFLRKFFRDSSKSHSRRIFPLFAAILIIFALIAAPVISNSPAYAAPDSSSTTDDPDDDDDDPCYTDSGALGWFMCPGLEHMSSFVYTVYSSWIEPALNINMDFFDNSDSNGLKKAWQGFQGFANIAVAIIILVVIISQLTGRGLSNYGIKSVLPRLIIMTILANLSFLVCQIAVEISNILGNSLVTLFAGFAGETDTSIAGVLSTTLTVIFGAATGGTYIFLSITSIVGSSGWAGLIFVVLIAVIGIVVAVAFFFALLGLRKAVVIACVAIAPLAIICNVLPNTQIFYKRWFNVFKTMLILYPMCGLAIGIGIFAYRIFDSVDSEQTPANVITKAALLFGPYFLIPSMTKRATAAIGELGARMSTMGQRARAGVGRTGNMLQQNPDFQSWQNKKNLDRLNKIESGGGAANAIRRRFGRSPRTQLSNRQLIQRAQYQQQANAELSDLENARAGVTPLSPETAQSRAEARVYAQNVRDYADQYDNLAGDNLEDTATTVFSNYRADDQNSVAAVQAMLSTLEKKNLAKKTLLGNGTAATAFAGMQLDSNNPNGAKVLQQLSGSSSLAISTYGKKGSGQTFNNFMSNTNLNSSNGPTGLAKALNDKGSSALLGADDDDLNAMQNSGALNSVNKNIIGAKLRDSVGKDKELNALGNQVGSLSASDIGGASGFGKLNTAAINKLDPSVTNEIAKQVGEQYNTEAGKQLFNSMSSDAQQAISTNPEFASAVAAQATAAQQSQADTQQVIQDAIRQGMADRPIEVREYEPKIQISGQPNQRITGRVMSDGRVIDNNGQEIDQSLYRQRKS